LSRIALLLAALMLVASVLALFVLSSFSCLWLSPNNNGTTIKQQCTNSVIRM
jgi:hypothetical protein